MKLYRTFSRENTTTLVSFHGTYTTEYIPFPTAYAAFLTGAFLAAYSNASLN